MQIGIRISFGDSCGAYVCTVVVVVGAVAGVVVERRRRAPAWCSVSSSPSCWMSWRTSCDDSSSPKCSPSCSVPDRRAPRGTPKNVRYVARTV